LYLREGSLDDAAYPDGWPLALVQRVAAKKDKLRHEGPKLRHQRLPLTIRVGPEDRRRRHFAWGMAPGLSQ
jgi:hypothetical protein